MGSQIKHKHAPPGQMVDVGGFRLHTLVCGQGTPTVLLEPALGGFVVSDRPSSIIFCSISVLLSRIGPSCSRLLASMTAWISAIASGLF